jgi:hypothetical protein
MQYTCFSFQGHKNYKLGMYVALGNHQSEFLSIFIYVFKEKVGHVETTWRARALSSSFTAAKTGKNIQR